MATYHVPLCMTAPAVAVHSHAIENQHGITWRRDGAHGRLPSSPLPPNVGSRGLCRRLSAVITWFLPRRRAGLPSGCQRWGRGFQFLVECRLATVATAMQEAPQALVFPEGLAVSGVTYGT